MTIYKYIIYINNILNPKADILYSVKDRTLTVVKVTNMNFFFLTWTFCIHDFGFPKEHSTAKNLQYTVSAQRFFSKDFYKAIFTQVTVMFW